MQARQHGGYFAFKIPATRHINLMLELLELNEIFVAVTGHQLMSQGMVGCQQSTGFRQPLSDKIEHRDGRGLGKLLSEPGITKVRLTPDRATIRLQGAIDDLQERGLAGAITANEANALAATDLELDLVQQNIKPKGQRDTF